MNNSKSNLGRRSKRPELKANIIFSMFQEYLFTYISASLQRHLAGTPTVVVSNFLEKFEMVTTFLFMAVHIWIFDMLFVYVPKLSGTQ